LVVAAAATLLGVAAVSSPPLVAAGTSQAIECGQVVESSLDPDDTDLGDGTWLESYDFTLSVSSTISVLMTTDDFNPYIIITDDDVVTVQEGEPPHIDILPAGDYTLFANNLEVLPPGDYPYALSLSCTSQEVERIRCGQTVSGQLDPTDEGFDLGTWIDPFDVTIKTRTRVRFRLETDTFRGIILIGDGDGKALGSGFDPYTVDLAPGEYTAFANNFLPLPDDTYPYRFAMDCSAIDCSGDCDSDGQVSISELIRGVRLALGEADEGCTAFDLDGDGRVAISELIAAVRTSLQGCE
jgi:hypothetical protein